MIILNIKPLSINKCWQGRRFKTKDYEQYEHDLSILLSRIKNRYKGEISVSFIFYMKNAGKSDIDNPIKPLLDILVKNKIIEDDRNIVYLEVRKFKYKEDRIEIEIKELSTV